MFQEPESIVYQHVSEIGQIAPDQGYGNWVRVGAVISNLLEPPHSGRRKFLVVLRLFDNDNMPEISLGFSNPDEDGLLWQWTLEFEYEVLEKGYKEAAEHRGQAKTLSVRCLRAALVGTDQQRVWRHQFCGIVVHRQDFRPIPCRVSVGRVEGEPLPV